MDHFDVSVDAALLSRYNAGDGNVFDALFRKWYAPLVGFAQRVTCERADAEDVVQNVMGELWRRCGSLQIQGSLSGYLHTATRNRALNAIRSSRHAVPVAAIDAERPGPSTDTLLEHAEFEVAVWEAVGTLAPACQEIFMLSRAQGLRYAEIAVTLGVSVKTVETQMGRALRILRTKLEPWLIENSQT